MKKKKINGEMWMLRIKSLVPRGLGREVTMGKSCGAVWWQIEHGSLQIMQQYWWKEKFVGPKILIVSKDIQGCKNVKLHTLGVLWGNISCP